MIKPKLTVEEADACLIVLTNVIVSLGEDKASGKTVGQLQAAMESREIYSSARKKIEYARHRAYTNFMA